MKGPLSFLLPQFDHDSCLLYPASPRINGEPGLDKGFLGGVTRLLQYNYAKNYQILLAYWTSSYFYASSSVRRRRIYKSSSILSKGEILFLKIKNLYSVFLAPWTLNLERFGSAGLWCGIFPIAEAVFRVFDYRLCEFARHLPVPKAPRS